MKKANPNTRSSAYSAEPLPASNQGRIEHWLRQCSEYLQLASNAQAQGLHYAKLSGDSANKAKKLTRRIGGSWLRVLKNRFAGRAARTVQDYMRISNEWGRQLAPIRSQHPDLSIEGALRYLRTGSIERKKKNGFDAFEFATSREWTAMLNEAWASWTAEEKEMLRLQPGRFREMMDELRKKMNGKAPTKRKFYQGLRQYQKALSELTVDDCRFSNGGKMRKLNKCTYAAMFDPAALTKTFKEVAPDVSEWRKEQKRIAKAKRSGATRRSGAQVN